MKSGILTKDRAALIKLCRAMTPEQRLVAFFNHSRLTHQLYQSGKVSRQRPAKSLKRKYSSGHDR